MSKVLSRAAQEPFLYRHIIVARIVIVFWLVGWYCKAIFFVPYFLRSIHHYPLVYDFFPFVFRHNILSAVVYFLPLLALLTLKWRTVAVFRLMAAVMVTCALVLLWHINTYNDATFVTSFWVGLWLLWFTQKMGQKEQQIFPQACFFTQALVGMIFLGGAVGKLTPEYWQGGVLYHIFFEPKGQQPIEWILLRFTDAIPYSWIAWLSRMILIGEILLAFSPLLSFRAAFMLGWLMIPWFMLFSTWMIFSVTSPLLGLLLACWIWGRCPDVHPLGSVGPDVR